MTVISAHSYKNKLNYFISQNYQQKKYYVLNKRFHPILDYKYIQMKHCNDHVDNLAVEYIYCTYHHRNLICIDILLVVYSILVVDHILYDTLVHHRHHQSILAYILHHHCHCIYSVNVHFQEFRRPIKKIKLMIFCKTSFKSRGVTRYDGTEHRTRGYLNPLFFISTFNKK